MRRYDIVRQKYNSNVEDKLNNTSIWDGITRNTNKTLPNFRLHLNCICKQPPNQLVVYVFTSPDGSHKTVENRRR